MKPMKIYVAFTVLGDRGKLEMMDSMLRVLHSRGHRVLTTHLFSKNVRAEEALRSAEFVFERDMKWLEECDAVIAEVSSCGFGVGFEAGYLLGKGKKKVFLLYDEDEKERVSRMARGNTLKNCVRVPYNSMSDIYKFVEENF